MADTFKKQKLEYSGDNSTESIQEFCNLQNEYEQSIIDFKSSHNAPNYYEDDNCIIMYANTEKIVNGEAVDRTQDADYIAEQKKQLILEAKATRDTAINEITNAKLLDDLQLDAGTITQAIYNARKTARLAQLAEVQTTFYTTTGLTQPTTITA